ncbi:MAG: acetyl-CoA C-acyltransferase [Candidatus Eremiobacter antarcticus]|nr:thiolase family protein [Candidatus Eremiobacteraeota bacterium]MBC5808708.1 thiolase family protein [Candidatus Eremiobacteraeota bacterium]PZR62187.1 MAG: acetyl-CoA C-acyltransferase [Candidatus Eremiobacter sp. RRmetagenome_bin22]
MQSALIVSAVRTPIGRFGGMFKDLTPVELGAHVMRAALERAGVSGEQLDLYVFGNVLRAGHGQLLPRQAALKAGIADTVDGYAVDMVCSSGMMSVMNANNVVALGDADLVLAGGFESMTQTGFMISQRARWGYKLLLGAPETMTDVLLYDGLTDPTNGEAMGQESERLAREYGIGRHELDEWAVLSHARAADATSREIFAREIAAVEVKTKRGAEKVDQDEGVRPDTTMESLASLRPAFSKDGVLTAGNSSQISDGAAAVVLAGESAVAKHGLRPLAKILGASWSAGPTWRFAEAPIPAVKKLLQKLSMDLDDFDLFENNEAFALSNALFERQLGVSRERLNVHGGAIALGHPIGASGARLIVTLLNALEERDATYGLASLCHGTGGSTALAVERLNTATS